SSRRRHTRLSRDWSSDVCSSDLRAEMRIHLHIVAGIVLVVGRRFKEGREVDGVDAERFQMVQMVDDALQVAAEEGIRRRLAAPRSEERRAGDAWRARAGTSASIA